MPNRNPIKKKPKAPPTLGGKHQGMEGIGHHWSLTSGVAACNLVSPCSKVAMICPSHFSRSAHAPAGSWGISKKRSVSAKQLLCIIIIIMLLHVHVMRSNLIG